jgi:hypothetical protein
VTGSFLEAQPQDWYCNVPTAGLQKYIHPAKVSRRPAKVCRISVSRIRGVILYPTCTYALGQADTIVVFVPSRITSMTPLNAGVRLMT